MGDSLVCKSLVQKVIVVIAESIDSFVNIVDSACSRVNTLIFSKGHVGVCG